MCGIVGYVGSDKSVEVLLGGLKRLEYRGYDSAGVAVIGPDGTLDMRKKAGKLQMLVDDLDAAPLVNGSTGIGLGSASTGGGPYVTGKLTPRPLRAAPRAGPAAI